MLKKIELNNFRCFDRSSVDLSGGSVVFLGANGTGKTSILEAICMLSTLRSFRTSKGVEMRKNGTPGFVLRLTASSNGIWDTEYTVSDFNERKLFIDSRPVRKASEFIENFKTVTFLPDDPLIVTGSPVYRRRFIDMFISMLDQDYFFSLQRYLCAVRNYNALLRRREVSDRNIYDSYSAVMALEAEVIISKRSRYLKLLEERTVFILKEIRPELSDFKMIFRFDPKTADRASFQKKVSVSFEKDRKRGMLSIGPHLDDFDLLCRDNPLRSCGSRGQCRIVSLALKLAELELVSEDSSGMIILVDDAVSDLDSQSKNSFLSRIDGKGQRFYTFTDLPDDELFRHSRIVKI